VSTHEISYIFDLVLNDALNGVDLETRHPAFYKQLLADDKLRQDFQDALD
jgi:hypothetical protein